MEKNQIVAPLANMNTSDASIADLTGMIRQNGAVDCSGLEGSETACCLTEVYRRAKRSLFIVAPTLKEAETIISDMQFFFGYAEESILFFPPYHITPFKPVDYNPATTAHRIKTLYRLITGDGAGIVVTTIEGLLQKIIPRAALSAFPEITMTGEEINRDRLLSHLISGGYTKTAIVEEPGDFSVRGSLIDIFSPLYPDPIRIEFYGDTVESMRTFSAVDQRSLKHLDEGIMLPAREVIILPDETEQIIKRFRALAKQLEIPFGRIENMIRRISEQQQFPGIGGFLPLIYPKLNNLTDYLPRDVIPVLIDPSSIKERGKTAEETITQSYLTARSKGRLCVEPETLYQPVDEALCFLQEQDSTIVFRALSVVGETTRSCHFKVQNNEPITQELRAAKGHEQLLRPFIKWIQECHDAGCLPTVTCADQKGTERIKGLLRPYGIDTFVDKIINPDRAYSGIGLRVCPGRLSSGFFWKKELLAIITEEEIFGPKHRRPKRRTPSVETRLIDFQDLKEEDIIVHIEHGIGQYQGLIRLEIEQHVNDFVLIEYRGNDKLYLPVDRLHNVQKYMGIEGVAPRLDRLGGSSWERVKEKAKKTIQKIAGELLQLYAWRKTQKGVAFSGSDQYFEEFEAAFEYEETPDQVRAIDEVLADMETDTPMDRLVCGDVGYGKTEVAMRAAFKAVCDSKQVAILVPTTVLLEQHLQTFKKRFERYPVIVAGLSRFRSTREQGTILRDLAEGKNDIIIGTHRLLQKDVAFKDLGLVIIDEEQRFGVKHKEKLKKMRRQVDVLALSATPIPRTLHMSMTGVRDLSVIMTPPEHRYPIKTYISRFDDAVITEAIMREMDRGGQIFFVHNNIRSIRAMARHIQKLIPRVRIGVAHGRLDEKELETVMLRFIRREIDLLICTTIIESGLDIPSANTIMINRADKFGLAQIYQLRGRVGRGEEQAYAYLFIPGENAVTRVAQKRLRVLMEHDKLGAGFQIALNDLQIRGGGAILGTSQSGQIAAVGYEMYLQLMEQAMQEIKGEPVEKELEPEINLGLSAYLPEDYIPEIDQRLTFYKRLSRMSEMEELDYFRNELNDRYGRLPEEADNLMEKIALKILAKKVRIINLDVSEHGMSFAFDRDHHADVEKIMDLANAYPRKVSVTPDHILKVKLPFKEITDPLKATKKIIKEITR